MPGDRSVEKLIADLKAGNRDAARQLWERYSERLIQLARKRMQGARRRSADEEDAALSAFDSFCRRAEEGKFPELHERDGLWRLLAVITVRKALKQIQHEKAAVHGGGRVHGHSYFGVPIGSDQEEGFEQFIAEEPTPELAAMVTEEYQRLLDCLGNNDLRTLAIWKMEGFTNDEIAHKLGCVERTVERKLRLIRSVWKKETTS